MISRRNWLFRCSIIANLAVILYIATHLMVKNIPGEYIYDPGRNLMSASDGSAITGDGIKSERLIVKVNESPSEQMRLFPLDKLKTEDKLDRNILDFESNKLNDGVNSSFSVIINSDKLDSENNALFKVNNSLDSGNGIDFINNGSKDNELDAAQQTASPNVVERDETILTPETLSKLKMILNCKDKNFESLIRQRGEFWVLQNYIKADHGLLSCHETLTYTTHGDFTFLDNVVPLLEKWDAPLSLAIYAPGADFQSSINAIRYLRDCVQGSDLVRKWTTFHIFFKALHLPKKIPSISTVLKSSYNCSLPPPYHVNSSSLYRYQQKLLYPVNVARNIARDAALTHFILASDIELYPSLSLPAKFLNFISRDPPSLHRKNPRVFPLSIFEVQSNQQVPLNKTKLIEMLNNGTAIPFHKKVCPNCHNVPKSKLWLKAKAEQLMDVFNIAKRNGAYIHWEPIFIGTNQDPMYDERLSWEGKSDKMTQAYAMCVLDYDFMILNNAFLVHRPGIKLLTKDVKRAQLAGKTNYMLQKHIYPELKILYGMRKGCAAK